MLQSSTHDKGYKIACQIHVTICWSLVFMLIVRSHTLRFCWL